MNQIFGFQALLQVHLHLLQSPTICYKIIISRTLNEKLKKNQNIGDIL